METGVAGTVRGDVEGEVDAGGFIVGSAEGFDDEEIFGIVGGENDPVAATEGDEFAGLEGGGHGGGVAQSRLGTLASFAAWTSAESREARGRRRRSASSR